LRRHVSRRDRRWYFPAKLVDASAAESHLDPLTAAPDRNRFLQTVVPFLPALR
jgi:hypothetical protein